MSKIEELIAQVYAARQEYWLIKFGRRQDETLAPPASEADVRTLEGLLGGSLPPSYRKFLSIHRAWPNFVGDAGILSPEDRDNVAIREQVKGFRSLHGDERAWRAFVVVAGESSHYVAYFDVDSHRPDGEMDIVEWSYEEGEMARHRDFEAYLDSRLRVYRRLISKETSQSISRTDKQ